MSKEMISRAGGWKILAVVPDIVRKQVHNRNLGSLDSSPSSIHLNREEARLHCWAASGLGIVDPARFVLRAAKRILTERERHY